jgi:hypothetical protein
MGHLVLECFEKTGSFLLQRNTKWTVSRIERTVELALRGSYMLPTWAAHSFYTSARSTTEIQLWSIERTFIHRSPFVTIPRGSIIETREEIRSPGLCEITLNHQPLLAFMRDIEQCTELSGSGAIRSGGIEDSPMIMTKRRVLMLVLFVIGLPLALALFSRLVLFVNVWLGGEPPTRCW